MNGHAEGFSRITGDTTTAAFGLLFEVDETDLYLFRATLNAGLHVPFTLYADWDAEIEVFVSAFGQPNITIDQVVELSPGVTYQLFTEAGGGVSEAGTVEFSMTLLNVREPGTALSLGLGLVILAAVSPSLA